MQIPSTEALAFLISWGTWVSVSIFTQRQELALLRQLIIIIKEKKLISIS